MKISNTQYTNVPSPKKDEDTPVPDPEYQPQVQWDDDDESKKTPLISSVSRAEGGALSQEQGNNQYIQDAPIKKVENKSEVSLLDTHAYESRVEREPILGYVLLFTDKTELAAPIDKFLIPIEKWGSQPVKDSLIKEFLNGRELTLLAERPLTRSSTFRNENLQDTLAKMAETTLTL